VAQTPNRKKAAAATAIAVALAAPAEGLRRVAYYDPPGILTVCYGSTTNVDKHKVYSIQECKDRLNTEMMGYAVMVEKCQPGLPPNVWAAFTDAAYNLGTKIVCNPSQSTAARFLYAKDYVMACNELPRWNRATILGVSVALPGLTKRRVLEQQLCLQKDTP